MSDIVAPLAFAFSLVLVTAMLCGAGLAAWRGWLDLKRLQLDRSAGSAPPSTREESEAEAGQLIELASVKERLRRLEAIANGVEL